MEEFRFEDVPLFIAVMALFIGYCHYFLSFPEDFKNGYKQSNQNNHNEKSKID